MLLTDPFLQRPRPDTTQVAWFTEVRGDSHHVLIGERVGALSEAQVRRVIAGAPTRGVEMVTAQTRALSRMAEDPDSHLPDDRKPATGIAARQIYRHHAEIDVQGDARTPYRVVSTMGEHLAVSGTFTVRGPMRPDRSAVIMLTSDHQLTVNTPANLEFAARVITEECGAIDAVFMPGDLVNVPDRASEWFDDARGAAFFPAMQGRAEAVATDGTVYRGGQILQHALLYPAVGNHDVQGRRDGHTSLAASFANPVPRKVAEAAYARRRGAGTPGHSEAQWIEDNSFSTTTFQEIFALPGADPFYATTVAGARLIVLFATRVWRGANADADPAARTASRYQEAGQDLADPLALGHGSFIFEDLGVGSRQYQWLRAQLGSAEFSAARHRVVMLHEGPQGLGENMMPHFTHPAATTEYDDGGALVGIRYDYPAADNILLRDVVPLLEEAGVDLVYSGHNHLWNRFVSPAGVHYLEGSNTGNSFGAFHPRSGRTRPAPPAPWNTEDVVRQGNPGGLPPVLPTVAPRCDEAGRPQPFVADGNLVVFHALHTGNGTVTSWYVDLNSADHRVVRFDEFTL